MKIRPAQPAEAALIQELIYELAVFEKAPESAQATVEQISGAFFADHPAVFCDLIEDDQQRCQGWQSGSSTTPPGLEPMASTWKISLFEQKPGVRVTARLFSLILPPSAWIGATTAFNGGSWIGMRSAIEFYKGLGATLMDEWTVMRVDGRGAFSSLSN